MGLETLCPPVHHDVLKIMPTLREIGVWSSQLLN